MLERTPGQPPKQDAAAWRARCTPQQRFMGMPPTGGCANCIPIPAGMLEGWQWVAVQIPEGVAPGETFEHLNHNGRFTMKVTVPEGAKAGETMGLEGNQRKRSDGEMRKSAVAKDATAERAAAEEQQTLLGRLATGIAARPDACSATDAPVDAHVGAPMSFPIFGDP